MAKAGNKAAGPKRARGRPKSEGGRGVLLAVRCKPELLSELDAWRESRDGPSPSRPAAIVYLLEQGLAAAKARKTVR